MYSFLKSLFDFDRDIETKIVLPLDRATWYKLKKHRNFIKKISAAVFYLHTYGIVHRDLKPENVMIDETVKLFKSILILF